MSRSFVNYPKIFALHLTTHVFFGFLGFGGLSGYSYASGGGTSLIRLLLLMYPYSKTSCDTIFDGCQGHRRASAEKIVLVATPSDTEDNAIDSIKAELLKCVWWSQVQAIIDNLTKDKQDIVWEALTTEQKRYVKGMKVQNRFNQSDTNDETTDIPTLQIGQYVNWDEGYPYIQSYMPMKIEKITPDGRAKLELCSFTVPIEQLTVAATS